MLGASELVESVGEADCAVVGDIDDSNMLGSADGSFVVKSFGVVEVGVKVKMVIGSDDGSFVEALNKSLAAEEGGKVNVEIGSDDG